MQSTIEGEVQRFPIYPMPPHRYCCLVTKSCPTLCNPTDCSSLGSSVRGILQARILEWAAISFSRGSSQPRDRTCVSCIGRWILYHWDTREAPHGHSLPHYQHPPTKVEYLLQLMSLHWYIIPFTHNAVHSMGLDKCLNIYLSFWYYTENFHCLKHPLCPMYTSLPTNTQKNHWSFYWP